MVTSCPETGSCLQQRLNLCVPGDPCIEPGIRQNVLIVEWFLQTVQERINMLVQSRYMQHTEAVMKNPILFGDYRSAKNVRLNDDPCYGLSCSLLQCLLGCFVLGCFVTGCVILKSTWITVDVQGLVEGNRADPCSEHG